VNRWSSDCTYFETSAKTGSGYDTVDFLVEDAIKRGYYK